MKKAVIWVTLIGAAITLIVMFFMSHESTGSTNGNGAKTVTQGRSIQEQSEQEDRENFVLHPGQGRKITSNYRRVHCKVTGPCMVRERDGAWFGQWKKDGPGRETDFDFSAAKEIEYWVPNNFPGPVAIVATR